MAHLHDGHLSLHLLSVFHIHNVALHTMVDIEKYKTCFYTLKENRKSDKLKPWPVDTAGVY